MFLGHQKSEFPTNTWPAYEIKKSYFVRRNTNSANSLVYVRKCTTSQKATKKSSNVHIQQTTAKLCREIENLE